MPHYDADGALIFTPRSLSPAEQVLADIRAQHEQKLLVKAGNIARIERQKEAIHDLIALVELPTRPTSRHSSENGPNYHKLDNEGFAQQLRDRIGDLETLAKGLELEILSVL